MTCPDPSPQERGGPRPEALSGLVERVTFHNEENGYSVLKVQCRGIRDLVTVVGSVPSVHAGEWMQAEGHWIQDRQFGRQFKAITLAAVPPSSLEGIERYLGSGLIKGIGPVYAQKLVQKFGNSVLQVIDESSARLEEVEGIGPKRRRQIKEAWNAQKVVREIMVFLHSHGVGTGRAVRIYKTYGEQAIERVRADPYILAREIPGIGFRTADQIGQRLGLARDSILRLAAGLQHVLWEATNVGNCALPLPVLLQKAAELLGVESPVLGPALDRCVASGEVFRELLDGQELVYVRWLRECEQRIADQIRALAAAPPSFPPIDIAKALVWVREKSGLDLAPSQQAAIEAVLRQRVSVITGGPGVGKTTILKSILRILTAKRVVCLLAAPTGRAAKRLAEATGMDARTVHRLLEAQPGRARFGRDEENPLECDLLVVDEFSMVDVPLMAGILRALPARCHLLLVGDADQLPSVGPGRVLHDIIACGRVTTVRLTEVFRQAASSRIITTAHRINQGLMPEPDLPRDGDCHVIDRETPEAILATLLEVVSVRIPQRFGLDPVRDIQVLAPMNRGDLGIRELNLRLQTLLNPAVEGRPQAERFGWTFRLGDKVIQTENNYDKQVYNGDIGIITGVELEDQELEVTFDGTRVRYEFNELDELALAYAITIHKSQGSEFPAVVIPLAMQQFLLLKRNLIYTGVTRGRKLTVIIGQRKALSMAVRQADAEERYSGLLARLSAQ